MVRSTKVAPVVSCRDVAVTRKPSRCTASNTLFMLPASGAERTVFNIPSRPNRSSRTDTLGDACTARHKPADSGVNRPSATPFCCSAAESWASACAISLMAGLIFRAAANARSFSADVARLYFVKAATPSRSVAKMQKPEQAQYPCALRRGGDHAWLALGK